MFLFTSEKEKSYAIACLTFAEKIGLINDKSLEAVALRCENENKRREEALGKGDVVYGLRKFTLPVYLDYELTRFRLDFAAEKDVIKKNYSYPAIDKKQLKEYYKNNRDLFTRYGGEKFRFKESELVVYKKIREEQYDAEINAILCQLS